MKVVSCAPRGACHCEKLQNCAKVCCQSLFGRKQCDESDGERLSNLRGFCGSVIIEKLPEPWQGLSGNNDCGALPVGPFLRDLQIEAPGIGLRVAKEYLALNLRGSNQMYYDGPGQLERPPCCPLCSPAQACYQAWLMLMRCTHVSTQLCRDHKKPVSRLRWAGQPSREHKKFSLPCSVLQPAHSPPMRSALLRHGKVRSSRNDACDTSATLLSHTAPSGGRALFTRGCLTRSISLQTTSSSPPLGASPVCCIVAWPGRAC